MATIRWHFLLVIMRNCSKLCCTLLGNLFLTERIHNAIKVMLLFSFYVLMCCWWFALCRLHCFSHLKCSYKDKASHIRGFICLSPFLMYFLHLLSYAVFPKIKELAKQTSSIFYFSYISTVSWCSFSCVVVVVVIVFLFSWKKTTLGKIYLTKHQKVYKKARKKCVCVTEYLTIRTDWRMSSSGPLTREMTLRHWRVSKAQESW